MDQPIKSTAYYPMLVSNAGTAEPLSKDEDAVIWKQYLALDEKKRLIITSHEVAKKILEFQTRFQLQESGAGIVSLIIRKILFGELDTVAAEEKIRSALTSSGGGDPVHAKAIVEAIQSEVMTIVPVLEPEVVEEVTQSYSGKTVKLPLLKAMSQYQRLSEQLITDEKIKLRGSPEPVRPSLGHWLRSYREELGVGRHEPTLRGRFLFQSPNGKQLSNADRARINLILKSVEEEFPLEIDTEHQAIIFPKADDASMGLAQVTTRPMNRIIRPQGRPAPGNPAARSLSPSQPTPAKPSPLESFKPLFTKSAAPEKNVSGETLHFSTGHVLPAERETPDGVLQRNAALRAIQDPIQGIRRATTPPTTKSPYSIRPLRLRNGDNIAASAEAEA